MIKLIASDMDGTLLNSDHTISEGNIEAIRKAQELGVKLTIATGRSYDQVKPIADKFNLNCEFILMNGAEYRNEQGEILESITIGKDKLKDIIEIMEKEDLSIEIFSSNGILTSDYDKARAGLEERVRSFNSEKSEEEIQRILNEFIREGYFERYLNKMRKVYKEKHDLLLELLQPF